jgi:hypothetical protein
MKKLIFVIVSTLLVISILVNFSFYNIIKFQWDWDKEKLQEKTILIHYLDNGEHLVLLCHIKSTDYQGNIY